MKVLGIIAEYNPFHNGHLYHLRESIDIIKPDYTIAAISGHFTQRGQPTLLDKWDRTYMALKSGIDLVLELPTVYACQTAELFALGGIQLLHNTGVVTHISFGSETGYITPLKFISKIFEEEPEDYKYILKSCLNKGMSFADARSKALIQYLEQTDKCKIASTHIEDIIKSPNSILAIEYIKALKRLKSDIEPITIKRVGSTYHSSQIESGLASATSIRHEIVKNGLTSLVKNCLPPYSNEIIEQSMLSGKCPINYETFSSIILGIIRRSSTDQIKSWMDVEEGLEFRLKKCGISASNISEMLSNAKTKRYAYTRLERILVHGLLSITTEKMQRFKKANGPQYIRILGFRKQASPLIKEIKESARVPVITKSTHYKRYNNPVLKEMFQIDLLATDLYMLGMPNPKYRVGGQDNIRNNIII